ncbi:MAG: transcription antitermination factor NusB [Myxococcota bacterium]
MASRRRAREFALQALFQADLREITVSAALNDLWSGMMDGEGLDDGRPPESEEVEFAQRLARGVDERRTEIDALIEDSSTNWRLVRMPIVDRNVLRIAAFELLGCPDIPATVSINEAIELAKRYGSGDSRAFVNGIVDRIARQLGRLDNRR